MFIFLSCKEEKTDFTILDVTVRDFYTNDILPISFAEIKEVGPNAHYETIHSVYDFPGHYSYEFNAIENESFFYSLDIFVDGMNYEPVDWENTIPLVKGEHNLFILPVKPRGDIHFRIKNVACFDAMDEFTLKEKNLTSSIDNYDEPITLLGCNELWTSTETKGPGTYALEWEVKKGAGVATFYDTVEVSLGETVEFSINY